jgi:hypothetical protein
MRSENAGGSPDLIAFFSLFALLTGPEFPRVRGSDDGPGKDLGEGGERLHSLKPMG